MHFIIILVSLLIAVAILIYNPTSGPGRYTPYEGTDFNFFTISLGGSGHQDPGTFYIRNFVFE